MKVVHTLDYIARKEPDKKDSFIGALKLPWAKEKSTDSGARLGVHHEQARRCCEVAAVMQRGVLMLDEVGPTAAPTLTPNSNPNP